MKRAGGGFDQSDNGQTAVHAHAQIIVAAQLSHCAAHSGQLPKMLAAIDANLGEIPAHVITDTGYRAQAVFAQLASHAANIMVSLARQGRGMASHDAMKSAYTAAMAAKMATPEAQAAYGRRKAIVEAPNGWIKHVMGFG